MSGRGSSGGGFGGGEGDPEPSSCETLRFDAQLTSPQQAVVAILQPGDVLDIVVASMKGQTIVQVLKSGQLAGSLTGPDAIQLRTCIDQGHIYRATVLSVNSGQIRVRVEHV